MIKQLIFVEEGTVDIDKLMDNLTEETKVIVYRQGGCKPEIINTQIKTLDDNTIARFKREAVALCEALLREKSLTKRAKKLITEFGEDYLWG